MTRINRELGGNFDTSKFQHLGHYNPVIGAMESYIYSKEAQTVEIKDLQRSFQFDAWEGIHTEYSFKFTERTISTFAEDSGYEVVENFYDSKGWYCDSLWQVKK